MAVLKAVNVKVGKNASLKGIINYVLQPKKTEEQLTTGFCCDVPKALETFMDTKRCFGKMNGRQYYHFVQSFPPNENITAQQAHEAAVEFAEKCKKIRGFEMLIVTHKDKEHLHTHFVMNSVSFVDGHKFHITRDELTEMKELQNRICIELGYSAAPKKGYDMFGNLRTSITANNSKTFQQLKEAENNPKDSYIFHCSRAVLTSLNMATSKEQFILLMHSQGYETNWSDNRKHITFTDIQREAAGETKCKVRLSKFADYFGEFINLKTKEDILNELYKNTTKSNRSNNIGSAIESTNSIKSKVRTGADYFDFNSGYEKYSSDVDSERAKHTTEENTRRTIELAEIARKELEREEKRKREKQRINTERTETNGILNIRNYRKNDEETNRAVTERTSQTSASSNSGNKEVKKNNGRHR